MRQRLFFLLIILLLGAAPALAQENGAPVPGQMQGAAAFQHVLDTRCTVCHTLQRVEKARQEHRDIKALEKSMVRKGAVLSESDRKVLGTFWGTPFKTKENRAN